MYQEAIFALNPTSQDPKQLLKLLEREARDDGYVKQEKLDKASIENLKGAIGANLGKGFGAKPTTDD